MAFPLARQADEFLLIFDRDGHFRLVPPDDFGPADKRLLARVLAAVRAATRLVLVQPGE